MSKICSKSEIFKFRYIDFKTLLDAKNCLQTVLRTLESVLNAHITPNQTFQRTKFYLKKWHPEICGKTAIFNVFTWSGRDKNQLAELTPRSKIDVKLREGFQIQETLAPDLWENKFKKVCGKSNFHIFFTFGIFKPFPTVFVVFK